MAFDVEIREFVETRERATHEAAQTAALQIVCGLDLVAVLAASRDDREKALARVSRMVKRERHRGATRHWSYDLNRHIALKQVCDRLRATLEPERTTTTETAKFSRHAEAWARRSGNREGGEVPPPSV